MLVGNLLHVIDLKLCEHALLARLESIGDLGVTLPPLRGGGGGGGGGGRNTPTLLHRVSWQYPRDTRL